MCVCVYYRIIMACLCMIGNIFVCIVLLPHINCRACFQSEFFIKDIEGVRSASVIIEIFELDTIKEGEIGVK